MIILNNSIYSLHVITTTHLTVIGLCIFVPLLWFTLLGILENHTNFDIDDNSFSLIFTIICTFALIIGIIIGLIFLIAYVKSPQDELILYSAMQAEGEMLQKIVTNSNEIINKDLYQQVIEFNKQLNINREYASDPFYAPMRWHMDWNAIPSITFINSIT